MDHTRPEYIKEFYYITIFAVSYIAALLIQRNNNWVYFSTFFNATGTIACIPLLKIEINQINYLGFKSYIASFWNVADLMLIIFYLFAYLPLNYVHDSINFENEWRLVNFILIVMTFVKIN
jgi:hypothetical protein